MADTLITGASGFIGTHLTRMLCQQGRQVRCLVRSTSRIDRLEPLGVELVQGSLEDRAAVRRAVQGVDCVIHLAGLTSAFRYATLLQVNGAGTANVARACAQQPNPPVLVICSSIAAAGPTAVGHLRTEAERPNPISCYGHSKRAGERVGEHYARLVPTTIVRPGIVFGEENREMLPIFRTIRRFRCHVVAGLRSPPLSFIEVRDLARLLVAAAERGRRLPESAAQDGDRRGCYFACVPEYPDYYRLGRWLREMLDRPGAWILHFPEPLPWVLAGINELAARTRRQPDDFNVDKIREATADSWACSCAAARRDLAFRPTAPLAEQLRATCQWYCDHGWL